MASPVTPVPPAGYDALAAELRAFELFKKDFKTRWGPGSLVFSQYEYLGDLTTYAGPNPGSLIIKGNPAQTRVVQALAEDFRRWVRAADYRKCDGMGLDPTATVGEILEVTTSRNRASAITQVRDKLDTLNRTVGGVLDATPYSFLLPSWDRAPRANVPYSGRPLIWMGTPWKPLRPDELFYMLPPDKAIYYGDSEEAPPGVVLYQIFRFQPQPEPVRVPSFVPQSVIDEIKRLVDRLKRVTSGAVRWVEGQVTTLVRHVEQYFREHAWLRHALDDLLWALEVVAALALIVAIVVAAAFVAAEAMAAAAVAALAVAIFTAVRSPGQA